MSLGAKLSSGFVGHLNGSDDLELGVIYTRDTLWEALDEVGKARLDKFHGGNYRVTRLLSGGDAVPTEVEIEWAG